MSKKFDKHPHFKSSLYVWNNVSLASSSTREHRQEALISGFLRRLRVKSDSFSFETCLDRANACTVSFATAQSLLLPVHRLSPWFSSALPPQTDTVVAWPSRNTNPLPVHPRARDRIRHVNLFLSREFLTNDLTMIFADELLQSPRQRDSR